MFISLYYSSLLQCEPSAGPGHLRRGRADLRAAASRGGQATQVTEHPGTLSTAMFKCAGSLVQARGGRGFIDFVCFHATEAFLFQHFNCNNFRMTEIKAYIQSPIQAGD